MMLARLHVQAGPDEPWLPVENGALFPGPLVALFAAAINEALPGGQVRLTAVSPTTARLLYPDAYRTALQRFPTVLTPAAVQGTTPNEEPPACQR